ncbi:hypothetical protein CPB84DRAFT_1772566 [Gymnopilus junonius]|uniref:NAD(P)-binding protein n=1 Tax=Gymnopilus junonius TaxID=109634 RepID=A0A9P5NTF6_GYMJU|nr:hypothetical protein CPB84DRAFT_1772566 [Gymnopilus junonius]
MTTSDELVVRYANHIKDKVIITTGVSPGSLGAYFVQAVAKAHPAWIILASRNLKKAQQTQEVIAASSPDVKTRIVQLDLESLQSVRDAAAAVNSWSDIPVVDVLVNNAGMLAETYGLTVDGIERQFAAIYLGHFYYNFDGGKTYNRLLAYGQAKTASILMAISLAQKLGQRGLLSFSLHPGTILTNAAADLDLEAYVVELLGNKEGFVNGSFPEVLTIEQGTATHVYAAFDPDLSGNNGAYLINCHPADPLTDAVKPWVTSPFEAEKLWRLSEKLVGQNFSY